MGTAVAGVANARELRLACENKDRLGGRAEEIAADTGDLPSRCDAMCGELRAACLNKDRLGEQGEGNCRRHQT
jgi:hypothetical protein